MSNYIENPNSCRVDFFKESGKWYTTEAVEFLSNDYNNSSIHEALKNALAKAIGNRLRGMQAVCLEPYHKYSHPISLIWEGTDCGRKKQ